MLKDSEIKCLEDKIVKLEDEKEKFKKVCVDLERWNLDLKVIDEKFKYEKKKVENDFFLLKMKF